MAKHHAREGDDSLSTLMDSRTQPALTWQQLIYLNPESKKLELYRLREEFETQDANQR